MQPRGGPDLIQRKVALNLPHSSMLLAFFYVAWRLSGSGNLAVDMAALVCKHGAIDLLRWRAVFGGPAGRREQWPSADRASRRPRSGREPADQAPLPVRRLGAVGGLHEPKDASSVLAEIDAIARKLEQQRKRHFRADGTY